MHMKYLNSTSLPSASQIYCTDWYLRIRNEKLSKLTWKHLYSVVDSEEPSTAKKGYTDWQATSDGRLLSLSWDWVQEFDCGVIFNSDGGLRTNILCVDDQGYDLSIASSEALLSKIIERLEWHHFVIGLH